MQKYAQLIGVQQVHSQPTGAEQPHNYLLALTKIRLTIYCPHPHPKIPLKPNHNNNQ